ALRTAGPHLSRSNPVKRRKPDPIDAVEESEMKKLTIRWSMAALAMAAGASGACSPDNVAETDPETQGVINQLQNEIETASAQGAIQASYKNVKPILKCVEKISSSTYKAHWGYKNSSSSNVSIPVGFNNRFWPSPINQGQPTTFL